MPILLQWQKLPWKGDRGWKKVSLFLFFGGWPEDCEFIEKMRFGASYSTSNKLLLIARHIIWLQASKNAFKVGSVKFTNSLSPPSIVKNVRTGSKSSQGTKVMPGKSRGCWQPCLNLPILLIQLVFCFFSFFFCPLSKWFWSKFRGDNAEQFWWCVSLNMGIKCHKMSILEQKCK